MEAHVTAQSQTYRLHERAKEADIRHGQDVRADVPRVRVRATSETTGWFGRRSTVVGRAEVFFCNMGRMRVREVISTGDDEPLPTNVVVENLVVPESGMYDLVNVLVRSNGDLRLIVDEETQIVPALGTEAAWV